MAHTATQIAHVAAELTEAFNDSDWERGRRLCTPDVTYDETGTGRRVEGVDAYVELLEAWKQVLPDVRGTIRRSLADGDTVAQDILWEGTHTGPMPMPTGTLEPTGKHISLRGTVWVTFEGEKARAVHNQIDLFGLLQQIGALPAG
jgi:steroid delta-isomerase-like uncharacterized protein